jgi:sec-independent protein translocase protein TatA
MEGLFQPMHLLVIFFIALLIFGPKKLPELGKGIGEGFRALKEGMKDKPADQNTNPASAAPATNTDVKH